MRTVPENSIRALTEHKRQSIIDTRQKLELALRRLINGNPRIVKKGTKISISSVATEASVDRVTIYRFHESILAEIRKINDTEPKAQLKESRSELSQSNTKLKEYRKLVEEAQAEVTALARVNYRLDARVIELEELIRVRDKCIDDLQRHVNTASVVKRIRP